MEESKDLQTSRDVIDKRRHPTPEMLISEAIKKNIPVETMEKLLAMRTQLKAEQAREAYYKALAKFQAECPIIPKGQAVNNKEGGGVRYKFAPLDVIISTVKSPLQNNGFSYSFTSKQTETTYTAICNSHHINGHSEPTEFTVPIEAKDYLHLSAQQKVGSARSFADRYAFCNAYGILTGDEDNDAQSANGGTEDKQKINKTTEYKELEKKILQEIDADCFTGDVEMDGKSWNLSNVAVQIKDFLADKVQEITALIRASDNVARLSLIAQERDKVQVDEEDEKVLSDDNLPFEEALNDVGKEGN